MKQLTIILGCFFLATALYAQQFGAFPPSVKWRQINTDTARIVFPAAVDSQAQDIAGIIHNIITQRPNSLGSNVRKINIILHNNTTLANGYVALGPFRSEYYLIPGSDIFEFGANPWYKELAAHEFRHVLQFSNFNKGLSKVGSILFGQEGQALLNALVIPDWFWEGDAVHAETSLTTQGRGRTPNFFNGYKALWREGRNYSWQKLRSGSLKDYVPDHYNLGYLLVNYGYLKYGSDFWRKVTQDAVSYKGLFYPFQHAIKEYAGVDYKTFRQEALNYYSHEVSRKRTDSVKSATVTNYYFPQNIGEDSLLFLKKSYKTLPAFYLKDKSGEHKLRLQNISTEEWFSFRNGVIAYTAYETNPRWSLIDYSSIYLYNIHTGRQTKITHKAKYFTPDISPSGNKIIAVLFDTTGKTVLQVLDNMGHIQRTIFSENHSQFVHPRFIDENSIVVTERLSNATMQMSRIDLSSGNKEILIPSTSALIGYPYPHNGLIYFVSSVAGIDDIYSLRLSDKKIFQNVSGVTGKYYPSVHDDTLFWSSFTSNGLAIQKKQIGNASEMNSELWKEVVLPYAVANAETSFNATTNLSRKFPESHYTQGAHLFNFHSWRPDYTDPEFTLSLYSDNMLNTFTNELYYRYNRDETSNAIGFNSAYGGWFPVISAGVDYNMGRSVATTTKQYELNSFEGKIGFNIPLDFTSGRMFRFFNAGSNFVYNHTYSTAQSKNFYDRSLEYLHHFIRWSHYLPQARQHIYPKFGYTLSGDLRHVINSSFGGNLLQNSQLLGGAQLFLPSIKNHSIVLSASYQRIDTNGVIFSNRFTMARGYDDYYYKKMWRISGNYHFPIAYPDIGLANIIFLQRIRGNIFYDYARVDTSRYFASPGLNSNLRSTGAEIYFDTKLWNELPVSFGIRGAYLLDNGRSFNDHKGNIWFELVLPSSLIPN